MDARIEVVMESAQDPLIGQVLNGRYRLTSLLGAGGMGRVYRATDQHLEREVAVKLLSDEASRDEGLAERFRREAKVLAAMSHPNVLQVFDHGVTSGGLLYLVTELLQGQPVNDYLRSRPARRMRAEVLMDVLLQLTSALATVHDRNVVHRDLKPHNIFLEEHEDGLRVRVLDFGIARRMASTTMATQQIIGTPPYMSPEQIRTEQTIDARADLYSLGVVAYECVSGRLPFPRPQVVEILMAHLHDAAPPLTADECPAELGALILQMLEKSPAARPPSARAVRETVKRLIQSGVGRAHTSRIQEAVARTDEAVTTPMPRPLLTQSIYVSPRPSRPLPEEMTRTPPAGPPAALLTSQAVALEQPRQRHRGPVVLGLVGLGAAAVALALVLVVRAGTKPAVEAVEAADIHRPHRIAPVDPHPTADAVAEAQAARGETAPGGRDAPRPSISRRVETASVVVESPAPSARPGGHEPPSAPRVERREAKSGDRSRAPKERRAAKEVLPPSPEPTRSPEPSPSVRPTAPTTGRVVVTGLTPTGQQPQIDVFEADRLLGSGVRVVLELAPGEHVLRVRQVGRESFKTRTVTVKPGTESSPRVLLD